MKTYLSLFLTAGCFSLFILKTACAQTAVDTSNLKQAALNNANARFANAIGEQSAFYNGPKYYFYNPTATRGSAYFQDKMASSGNVYYDDVAFKGVQLLYDLYKDELVTVLYDNYSYFSLLKENVQSFDLSGHHFININADSSGNNQGLKSGYYDELYRGRTEVLVKISKGIHETSSSTGTSEAFSSFTPATQNFFVRKNNVYYRVTGEGSFLDLLKDRKKQLQKYIKTNKIKFKKDPGQALADIAAYCDSLPN